MQNRYKIAGVIVDLDSFGKTVEQAKPYLYTGEEPAQITIRGDWESVHSQYPSLSQDACEHLSTGMRFYYHLIKFDGMMLHASAVVMDGKAYLFSATSGTGKSTHTGLWLKQFGERAYILNDDKPALRMEDGVWYAYGTPWSGKTDLNENARVPLAGIAFVERSETNYVEPAQGREVIFKLLEQTQKSAYAQHTVPLMELLDKLVSQVPAWKLHCNMDPEAAIVAYEAMSGKKKENEQ